MITLHGYWRSTASWRVRIALGLKDLPYRQVTHDLRTGEQRLGAFADLSPQGLVPAIEANGTILTQSLAIIEWLEEQWPEPRLLPNDPAGRAIVRAMSQIIACDIHPLNNLRVLTELRAQLGFDEAKVKDWIARWTRAGLAALEVLVARHGGLFAYGEAPGMADCCLVPQLFAAERFEVDVSDFPHLLAVADRARQLDAFSRAIPAVQPDAD
ncbi:maleylacetoacetate isomerase [Altererythrobacter sp. Root672]|nr:maleylacetoacetate isomerase [Altererythrobacter sp. Root672]